MGQAVSDSKMNIRTGLSPTIFHVPQGSSPVIPTLGVSSSDESRTKKGRLSLRQTSSYSSYASNHYGFRPIPHCKQYWFLNYDVVDSLPQQ
jgi:hypothetical protein